MKVAIISDVHGNYEALQAVLDEARSLGAGEVWSLGDVVGYGPQPGECMDRLDGEASRQIMGNHDAAVADLTPVNYFNENARRAVAWTRGVVGESGIERLAGLPYTSSGDGCLLVHGSPDDPPAWHYVTGPRDARDQFEHFTEQICFVGHTHVPLVVSEGDEAGGDRGSGKTFLEEGCRYFINAGSVGQPRDRDPRSAWVLFDRGERSVEIRRVPYDVEKTQSLMRENGLPSFLVDRIARGI